MLAILILSYPVTNAGSVGFEEHFCLEATCLQAKFTVHVSVEQVTPVKLIVNCPKSPSQVNEVVMYRYDTSPGSALAEGPFTVEAKAFVTSRDFRKLLPGPQSAATVEFDQALKKLAGLVCPIAAVRPTPVTKAIPAYRNNKDYSYRCSPTESSGPHTVAVSEAKRGVYPFWTGKPAAVSFSEADANYVPRYFNGIELYNKPWWSRGGYADANFISKSNDYDKKSDSGGPTLKRFSNSEIGALNGFGLAPSPQFNKSGFFKLRFDGKFPLNPCGRTGVIGRGTLGQWGPQFAADPIITKTVDIDGKESVVVLMITRKEVNENNKPYLAIPGGILDRVKKSGIASAESAAKAGERELFEETGIDIDVFTKDALTLYKGYSDDLRNTDNAWMETTVIWRDIVPDMELIEAFRGICPFDNGAQPTEKAIARCVRERLNLAKHFVKTYKSLVGETPPSGQILGCFTGGLTEGTIEMKNVAKLHTSVFSNSTIKTCKEAGESLGFSSNSLGNPKTLSDLDAINAMLLKVGSNAGSTKFKDTLVYYSEETDLITHDTAEGISARRWIPLDNLVAEENSNRLWASHALFIKELKERIYPRQH